MYARLKCGISYAYAKVELLYVIENVKLTLYNISSFFGVVEPLCNHSEELMK
jgi:hypothetical protein